MIESSMYNDYKIDFSQDYRTDDKAYYFIINSKREVYLDDNHLFLTTLNKIDFNINYVLYIGTYKNKDAFVVSTSDDIEFIPLIEIYNIDPLLYQIATRAVLVNDWYSSYQYCGRCGTKTVLDKKDMMLLCPKCGQMHYTRIAPAIIVAINNNGKLLMARHSYYTKIRYALIAGFVEAGESIEDAVRREVKEEVGIDIKNIQYQKSQSWPFPNSLMLGFCADYDGGEIKVDGDEILEAKWFNKEDIDVPESNISIASWLINDFLKKH
ncbi:MULTISPECIES: NAD(+) diphosphatase [Methanosphaera]|nr:MULTISPECIES: NAD(+) diphosphatase [Methanosphaera]MDO5822378.1 NAD(+) diphosphatase [Methanosphaera sp.]